jgi:hypothetical protein
MFSAQLPRMRVQYRLEFYEERLKEFRKERQAEMKQMERLSATLAKKRLVNHKEIPERAA